MYTSQESFLFHPTRLSSDYDFPFFENFEERFYDIDSTTTIHALYFKANKPKGVILYFHGNARSLDDWGYLAADLVEHQYDVLMQDYRSYGKSTGQLSEQAFHNDALVLYNDLLNSFEASEIIIFGRSLGSGVAAELAYQKNPKMLILETPYLSISQVAKEKMPFLPVSLLINYHFNNENIIDLINCPIHILHGTNDRLIPYRHAVQLASKSKQQNVLTTIEGGGHNNLSDFEVYREKLTEILK